MAICIAERMYCVHDGIHGGILQIIESVHPTNLNKLETRHFPELFLLPPGFGAERMASVPYMHPG